MQDKHPRYKQIQKANHEMEIHNKHKLAYIITNIINSISIGMNKVVNNVVNFIDSFYTKGE